MSKILRIAGYARVSHDEQKKFGYSINAQVERINKWVEKEEHILVDMFVDEGFSAGNMKRPALQELLKNLHKYDAIAFTRLDRFTRNVIESNKMLELLDKYKVSFIAIDEDRMDTSNADGRFTFNLKVSLAERELQKGSERIKSVFDYKVKNGQAITGSQPFGYKVEVIDGVKRVVKDDENRHIVDEIFAYFSMHQSVRQTMLHINDKYALNRCYSTYRRLLGNKYYTGAFKTNEAYCEPYITHEQHQRNLQIMKSNIRVAHENRVYLFTGLIKCPECGGTMCSNFAYPNRKRYRCNNAYTNRTCGNKKIISETKIEKALLETLETQMKEHIINAKKVQLRMQRNPEKEIANLKKELENLNYLFMKLRISVEDYESKYNELEGKIKRLQSEVMPVDDVSHLKAILDSEWLSVYNKFSVESRRVFWRNAVKKIHVEDGYKFRIEF